MQWSKLKKLIEQRMAPSVRDRITLNSTAYGECTCGHAWITIDKQIIANFCTRAFYNRWHPFGADGDLKREPIMSDAAFEKAQKAYVDQCVEYGEFRRQDLYVACWDFIHSLTIDQALASDDPLIQSLAVIDARLGKRRVAKLNPESLHPLARKLFSLRREAEGLPALGSNNASSRGDAP